jgi:hypothetical protein
MKGRGDLDLRSLLIILLYYVLFGPLFEVPLRSLEDVANSAFTSQNIDSTG